MDYRHHSRPPNQYDDDDAVATESDPLLLLPSCRGPKFVSPVRYDDVLEMEGGGGDRNNVDVAVVVHHDYRCLAITPPSGSSSQPSPHLYHYLRRIAALLVFVVLLVLVVLLLHDVATVTTIVVVRPQRVQIPFHRGIGSFFSAPALTFSVHKPSGVVTRQGDRHDDGSSSSISSLSAGAGAEARGCCIHRQAPSPHDQIPVDDDDNEDDDDDEICCCLELNRNLLLVQERTRRSHTASSTRPRARPAPAAATPKVRPAVVPSSSSLAPSSASSRSSINSLSAPVTYTKIGAVQTHPGMGPFFYYWFRRNVYEPILLKERRRGNNDGNGGGLLAFVLRPQRNYPDVLWVYQTFTSEGYYLNVHTPLLYTEDIVRTLVKLLLPDRAPLDLELRPALYTKGFDDPPPLAAARNASIAGGLRQTPKALSPVDGAGHGTDGNDDRTDDTTTSPPSGDAADHPLGGATVSIPPPLPLPLPPAGRASSSTSSSAFDDGPPLPPLPFPEPHPPHGPRTGRHRRSGRRSDDDSRSDDDGDSSYYTVLLYAETKPGQGHTFAAWFRTHVCETVVAHDGAVLSYAVHQEANTDDDHLWIIQTHKTERDFVRHARTVYPRCCGGGGEKRHGGCQRQSGTRGSTSGSNNQTIAEGMRSFLLGKVQYVALSPTSMVIGMNP